MPTPTKKDNEQRSPSRTTRILETVEQLLAMQEKQERREAPGRRASDELTQRIQSIEEKLVDITSQWPPATGLLEQVQDQLQQLERRLSSSLKNASRSSATSSNEKNLSSSERDRLVSAIEKRFGSRLEQLESKLQEQTGLLVEALEKTSALAKSNPQALSSAEEPGEFQETDDWQMTGSSISSDGSASHWHRQKEAMLAKYGIDPNYRPVDVAAAPAPTATMVLEEVPDKAVEKLEQLHKSIDRISPEDAEAIEDLKQELNAKLREAEIELSINRAKLSQQKAELEQQKAELKHRTADLEAKLASTRQARERQRPGLVGRLSRYLGGK